MAAGRGSVKLVKWPASSSRLDGQQQQARRRRPEQAKHTAFCCSKTLFASFHRKRRHLPLPAPQSRCCIMLAVGRKVACGAQNGELMEPKGCWLKEEIAIGKVRALRELFLWLLLLFQLLGRQQLQTCTLPRNAQVKACCCCCSIWSSAWLLQKLRWPSRRSFRSPRERQLSISINWSSINYVVSCCCCCCCRITTKVSNAIVSD